MGVPVSFIYPLVKTIVLKGHNKDDFFRRARIEESLLQDTEARLSGDDFERITELAATVTEDVAFGLHQGQSLEASDLGVLGYVMMHSKTVGQALAAYQKYNVILCNGFNISWVVEESDVIIDIGYTYPHKTPARHCIEEMVSSLYHIMIRLSCISIPLKEVHFTHTQPVEIAEYVAVMGIPPGFGKKANTIRMSKAVLEYPILFADTQLLTTFEFVAEEAKRRLLQGNLFSNQLYHWIINRMPMSFPSLKETALQFQMSVRSIQAKLNQENTTFMEIINRVRKELAMGYLAKPEYNIGEVAYLLHFSEPSAFQNAFKKWTGVTPKQHRMEVWKANNIKALKGGEATIHIS
ncbi:AraC family transcriptional regulator [Paenibacillus sp. S3N08]|uniref:AraC family transcriptional regulator n=1 Tax=Paenibacillus agricola TaxID=2716264 RepID=A0ABX0J6V6_9BACL|nr:AraC family transcriptional regulator [Paenibacillus agricola]